MNHIETACAQVLRIAAELLRDGYSARDLIRNAVCAYVLQTQDKRTLLGLMDELVRGGFVGSREMAALSEGSYKHVNAMLGVVSAICLNALSGIVEAYVVTDALGGGA